MQISNFRNLKQIPSEEFRNVFSLAAEVDVTTTKGILWWKTKHTETHQVFREELGVNWMWVETGKWTPGSDVENLYRAYCAKQKIERG